MLNETEKTVEKGETFWIAVQYDTSTGSEGPEVYGVQYTLQYNTTLLSATDSKVGSYLGNDSVVYSPTGDKVDITNSAGTVDFVLSRQEVNNGVTGQGDLTYIKFEVTEAIDAPLGALTNLTFSNVGISEPDGDSILTTTVPASIDTTDPVDPTAKFTASQTSANVSESVRFDAGTSSDNYRIDRYEWDFDGDNTFEETTDTATVTHIFDEIDTHEVTLKVIDSAGNEDTATTQIEVTDLLAPEANVTAQPLTAEINKTQVELDASASTDNKKVSEYAWDFDGDGEYEEETDTATTTHTFDQFGLVSVKVEASDAAGNTDTATVMVEVVDTTDPLASVTANQTEVPLSQAVTFDASGSSDNDDIAEYRWDFDGDGTVDTTTQSPTATHQYAERGDYTAEVTVVDDKNNSATATVDVSVVDGEPPEASIYVGTQTVNASETLEFSAGNSTDNVEIANYSWDFSDGTTDDEEVVTHTFEQTGTYTVELTVTDADGNRDTAGVNITVVDNQPPTVTASSATPNTAELNQTEVTFSVTAEDNVGISEYRWDLDGDDAVERSTDANTTTHIYTTRDNVTPTVRIDDANGNTVTETFGEVSVEDTTPPAIALTSPDSPVVNTTASFDASGTTDNGEITAYRWDFDGDGTVEKNTTGPSAEYEYTTANKTYTLELVVEDTAGNTNETTKTLTTTRAPTVEVISPANGSLVSQSQPTITYELQNLDAVDSVEAVEYAIDDRQWQAVNPSEDSISPTLSDGDHTIKLRLVDTSGQPLEFASATTSIIITVDSTAPTVDSLSISDGQIVNGSATLIATYSDETGSINQSASTFFVDGSETDIGTVGASEASVDVGQLDLADGEHTLTLSVTDDAGLTTNRSVSFVLDTTAPIVERFEANRTSMSANTPVSLAVNITEPHPEQATLVVRNASTAVYEKRLDSGFETETNVTWMAVNNDGATVPSGTYTLTVVANDTVGHSTTSANQTVTVDTDAPSINLRSPAPNAVINTTTPTLSATFDDHNESTDTGINTSTVSVTVDGNRIALSDNTVSPENVSVHLDNLSVDNAGNSTHTVSVSVADTAGNTATNQTTFTIDARGPSLNLSTNRRDRVSTNQPVRINVTRTDVRPNQTTIEFMPNGSTEPIRTQPLTNAIVDETIEVSWDATADGEAVDSGDYDIILRSTDAAGNTNTVGKTISVDNQKPEISDINLEDSVVVNDSVTIKAAANGTPGDVSNVSLGLDAVFTSFEYTTEATRTEDTWSATIPLNDATLPDDGTYTIIASATDPAANTVEETTDTNVTIDREAPELGATLEQINDSTGRVNVSIDDANPVFSSDSFNATLTYPNNTNQPISLERTADTAPQLTDTVPLAGNGNYTISVTGSDEAGNTAEAIAHADIRSIETNNTTTVKFEPSGTFLRFNTTDTVDSFVTVTTSDSPLAPLSPGFFGSGGFLDAQLGNNLSTSLNRGTIGIPTSTVDLPNGVEPEDAVIARYDGEWELREETTVQSVTLDDGTTDEYWLLDVDGFSTWGVIAPDQTAPTLESITPSDGSTVPYGTINQTVRFNYTDRLSGINVSAVAITFNGSDVTDSSQISSQYASYTATDLDPGEYQTNVTVVDNAGNDETFRANFTVPRDTDAPRLISRSVANNTEFAAETSEVDVTLNFSDTQSGLSTDAATVRFDGANVTQDALFRSDSPSNLTVRYRATGLSSGTTHNLTVSVEDGDENTRTSTVSFSIAAAPTTNIDSDGGGGGGGGGGAPAAPATIPSVIDSENNLETVDIGSDAEMAVAEQAEPVDRAVSFVGETNVMRVKLQGMADNVAVVRYDEPPQDLPETPGRTGTLTQIAVDGPAAEDPGTVQMRVHKSTLEAADASPEDVQIARYDASAGEWSMLDTKITNETDDSVLVKAETAHFSYFATVIATEKINTPKEGSPDNETEDTGEERQTPGFEVVIAVVVLLSAAFLARARR